MVQDRTSLVRKKLQWCGYTLPDGDRVGLCVAMSTQYQHVTDGHLATA